MQIGTLTQSCEYIYAEKKKEKKKAAWCDKDYNIVLSSQNLTKRLQRIYVGERQVKINWKKSSRLFV